MSDPTVSVIVPNYNHARYLPQRIESILNQTYQDFELILLDDASTDNSRRVIEEYAQQDKVQAHFNAQNTGSPFLQWEKGAQLAQGKYIWIAESDDFAHETLLETLVPVLEQRPNVGLAYCQSSKVDKHGTIIGDGLPRDNSNIDYRRWLEEYENQGHDEVVNYLVYKNIIPNASALLFRKSAYLRATGVPVQLRLCGDWLTYVKMLEITDIYYHPAKLNAFRVHDKTVRTKNSWGSINVLQERSKVLQYILEHFDVSKANKIEAVRPIYHDYLLNLAKLSFRFTKTKEYREVYQFLYPFTRHRQLKQEVYGALKKKLTSKGMSYFKPKGNATS